MENVSQFKYLGMTVRNKNFIQEEIKRGLNSGNACSYSIQNLLFSRVLSKNFKIGTYKAILLPVFLYGCETWYLTFWAEHRLRVYEVKVLRRRFGPKRDEVTREWRKLYEVKVLRRRFGPKRDEVTREWRKLHNEELRDLYSSPNTIRIIKSRRMRLMGHVTRMEDKRNVYSLLVGKPE
jgi:hypothetical protein